jgi:hypothetical protein
MSTLQPARGPSVLELHGYFATARADLEAARGGYDVKRREALHVSAALFANRVIRAPAAHVEEILLKLDAAGFVDLSLKEALAFVRTDLERIVAGKG